MTRPKDDNTSRLSPQERRVMAALFAYKPEVVPYLTIAKYVWGPDWASGNLASLRAIFTRMRKKIGHNCIDVFVGTGMRVNDRVPDWVFEEAKAEASALRIAIGGDSLRLIASNAPRTFSAGKRGNFNKKKKKLERGWPCLMQEGGCICTCHKVRQSLAATKKRQGFIKSPQANQWNAEQNEFLVAKWKELRWLPSVTLAVNERFHIKRTMEGVARQMNANGLSIRDGLRSMEETKNALGTGSRRANKWIVDGSLKARRHWSGNWWCIREEDLEEFVRVHGGQLERSRIRDKRLLTIHELHHRSNTGVSPVRPGRPRLPEDAS